MLSGKSDFFLSLCLVFLFFNIIQFIGATCGYNERPLIVTELLDRCLRSLIGERRLTNQEISVIALDVAKALNYLHRKQPSPIIHRDVSSANVLLWQGVTWRAKLSDYGAANFMSQCKSVNPGAPPYSAPEAGSQNQTPKVHNRDNTISLLLNPSTRLPRYKNERWQYSHYFVLKLDFRVT